MAINLNIFTLEPFNSDNREHRYTLNRLANQNNVKKYVSSKFEEFVKDADPNKKFDDGKAYVILKDEDQIGLFGSKRMDTKGIIELWVALKDSEAGKGYATKILVEITSYLLDNINELKDIKLVIDRNNYASKATAINGGYSFVSRDDTNNTETFQYFG